MRTLKEIKTDWLTIKERAEMDLEKVHARTLASFSASKRGAQEKLSLLRDEYQKAALASMAAILLVESPALSMTKANKFLDQAKNIMPTVNVAADILYQDLAKPVVKTMGVQGLWPRHMDIPQWEMLFHAMRKKAETLPDQILPNGKFVLYPETGKHVAPFSNINHVPGTIRNLVREANGDAFNQVIFTKALIDATLAADKLVECDPDFTPVIVTNIVAEEIPVLGALFGLGKVVVIELPRRDFITRDFVTEYFIKLQQTFINKDKG